MNTFGDFVAIDEQELQEINGGNVRIPIHKIVETVYKVTTAVKNAVDTYKSVSGGSSSSGSGSSGGTTVICHDGATCNFYFK